MKNKKFIIILSILALMLLAAILFLSRKNKGSVDWDTNFINTKTSPYGTYITFNLIKDIFDKEIKVTRKPIYNNLKPLVDEYIYYGGKPYHNDNTDNHKITKTSDNSIYRFDDIKLKDTTAYIFINTEFRLNNLDLKYLLNFVRIGNNVFISAEYLDENLADTLKLTIKKKYTFSADTLYTLTDYPNKEYPVRPIYYETKINTDSCPYPHKALSLSGEKIAGFVCIRFGKGNFYIHNSPNAFSNLYQLNLKKYDYAYRCLSYIPKNNRIIWDEYQKQGEIGETSIFRVLYNNPALKASLILLLTGMLLFMLFRAKRIQRIIPVIKPPVNSSVEFLETISNLYYRKKDYMAITEKRHAYFLDYIRKNYYLLTEKKDNTFIEILSAKSGVRKQIITEIFNLYNKIKDSGKNELSNNIFIKYNTLLEEFYSNAQKDKNQKAQNP